MIDDDYVGTDEDAGNAHRGITPEDTVYKDLATVPRAVDPDRPHRPVAVIGPGTIVVMIDLFDLEDAPVGDEIAVLEYTEVGFVY